MEVTPLHLNWFVNSLKNNRPFTFARYGDGEWLTILGFYGLHNSNGCTFTKALSDDMRNALKRQNPYHHAILKIARRERRVSYNSTSFSYGASTIQKWLDDNEILLPWYDGDVLLEQSLKGKLFPLIEQVREKRVLYIGNHRLRGLNLKGKGFFPYVAYIEPPPRDAHLVMDDILDQIYRAIRKHNIDLIGWSSGLAAKVMIDEVYMGYPDVTQIDFGSMFDGYFEPLEHIKNRPTNNTGSRSYIRKGGHDWEALLRMNTGVSDEF